jgi:AcrR family transcriptional regulator
MAQPPQRVATRKSTSALRSRHADTTREIIVDALVQQLAERDAFDISYAELSRRSGVSIQTLYRHFPTRTDLVDALTRRVAATFALAPYPQSRPALGGLIRQLFRGYDEHAALMTAQIHAGTVGTTRAKGRKGRIGAFQSLLATATPNVAAERRRAVAGLFHVLVSAMTWYRLRDELGLDGAASGEITAWAIDTLWRALEVEDERARKNQ